MGIITFLSACHFFGKYFSESKPRLSIISQCGINSKGKKLFSKLCKNKMKQSNEKQNMLVQRLGQELSGIHPI